MDAPSRQRSDTNLCSTKETSVEAFRQTNDLLSRVSSFLPQIRAANHAVLMERLPPPLLYQEDDENDEADNVSGDSSNLFHEIDPLEDVHQGFSSNNESDCSDDVETRKPSKKRKSEPQNPTIVMDLHFGQDIEHPLFQLLCDEKDEVEDDATDITNDQNTHVPHSEVLTPSTCQSAESNSSAAALCMSSGGPLLLPNNHGTRSSSLICVVPDQSND